MRNYWHPKSSTRHDIPIGTSVIVDIYGTELKAVVKAHSYQVGSTNDFPPTYKVHGEIVSNLSSRFFKRIGGVINPYFDNRDGDDYAQGQM